MYQYLLTLVVLCQVSRAYSDTNYRLNTPIKPKAYSIAITPYFDTNDTRKFTFDGEVAITFTTESITRQIKLHSEDLIYDESNIQVLNGASNVQLNTTNPLLFNTNYTFAYINLQADLQIGVEYSLKITYRGPIREDLNGFYRNYYIERGVKKWLGATQMEPTHARKAFPCFDEPELKATFTLSIDRPQNYKPSLANTKLQSTVQLSNGYVREVFHPTPIMSTYLVAFMVSEFDGIERLNGSKEIGIYTRPEALNQTDYALEFGMKVVDALGDYFGIDYYSTNAYLKLDHVALPDFRAGAMENWGLINYRESLLLYVPEDSTPYYKYRVAQIVAHETTHMWFGNLVTCHWWSNTWLNEGFANYFQDYITAMVDPDVASANALVTGSVYAAYDADSNPTAPPISNDNVNSPAEISGHFGTVTYQKAGSVIRMMHHFIGDEGFRHGLNNYLETNKFGSGYPEKMFSALDIGVQNTSSLAMFPNTDITEVMDSWISQAGHPVLQVGVNYETGNVLLTQKRFYLNSSYSSNEIYNIPITYTTGVNPDFTDTKPVMVMKNTTHQFTIPGINENRTWVIFNVQETGLYRVNYDDQTWDTISLALKSADREKIHHLNRAKIVNDLFAFFYADKVKFNRLQDVLEFVSEYETDYSVWYATIRGLNKLWHTYLGSEAITDIEAFLLNLLEGGIKNVGYAVKENDSFETLRNRMQILEFACKLGHEGCIEHSVALFRKLKENGTEISPSLRPVAYCNGLRFGNGDDYDFLWERMVTTNVASEARVIGEILGCTSDEGKLKSFLVSMEVENSPIKTQDLTVPLTSVLTNYTHTHLVLTELKENYVEWSTIYPSMNTVLTTLASALHTEEDFNDFESFLSSCVECKEEDRSAALQSLAQARASTAWADSHKDDILKNLRSHGAVITPSMMLVVVVAVAIESIVFC